MIKNYLLISLRNLYKNRVYAAINILGMGIALAVCIVAYFNYAFDYTFDRQHENFDEIYRLTSTRDMEGRSQEYGLIPAALSLEIKDEIPGVKNLTRLFNSYSPIKYDKELFSRRITYVDPEFFDIFTVRMKEGNPESLQERNNILISESFGNTLFGDNSPLGKSVSIINDANQEFTYTISGVFEDCQDNSSFRYDVLTHSDNFLSMWQINDTDWRAWTNVLFLQLNSEASKDAIIESLNSYLPQQNKAREDFVITGFNLVALDDVGDNSRELWVSSLFPGLHPAATLAPPIMAFFILLIACFNFANTTIATMGRRLKEIGLRKTFGGFRIQLIVQFFLESLVICTLATLVGIAIARFLVPAYSSLWEYMTLSMSMAGHWNFILFLLGLLLLTGFMSGVYPALYISRLNPVNILRSQTRFGKTGLVSHILLTLQFSISIMALVMGIVFIKNSDFQQNMDMGYERDKLITVPIISEHFEQYREAVKDNPLISVAAGTQQHIGFGIYRRPLKYRDLQVEVDVMDVGPEWTGAVGLRLKDGRLFDPLRVDADREGSVIVNEQFVKDFGMDNPVGQTLTMYDTTTFTIIGVVEDYLVAAVWRAVEPAILRLARSEDYFNLVVRTTPENMVEVKEYLKDKWQTLFPSYVFEGMFQEETMEEEKYLNESITKLNMFLAVVATILSLIGIYSLVSLSILHRTKEIGIRNVVGAPLIKIMALLNRKFIIILFIASLIGCAGGYYISAMLLDSIWDYFTDITIWMMLTAAIIMFAVTLITISAKTYRAAIQNPVDALQSE